MTRSHRTVLVALLVCHALLSAGLAIDIMLRVWVWRARFERPLDPLLLLYFEGTRALFTLAGCALAIIALRRAAKDPRLAQLPPLIALGTIAYTGIMAFDAFPGAFQEWLATGLRQAGTPDWLLLLVFAQPAWALWLSLAAALAFAASYPEAAEPEAVLRSGTTARKGALRSVAMAGTDVGAAAAGATAAALRRGWLRPHVVWITAGALGLLHSAAAIAAGDAATLVHVIAAAAAFPGVVAVVTLFRTGLASPDTRRRRTLVRLRAGALLTLLLAAVGAAATLLLPGGVAAAMILAQWPLPLAVGTAAALLPEPVVRAFSTAPYGTAGATDAWVEGEP